MPTWESCPPENLKSDLPVAVELVISPHREKIQDFDWLSHHGAEKMRRLKKKSKQRKCPTLPCSHVPMETYGFVSLYQSPSLETFFGSFKPLCFQSTWWHHTAALGQCLFGSVVSLCTNFMAAKGNLGCHEGCL